MQKDDQQKKLQNVLLDMLIWFNEFCQENNITYYLAGGTLLGAVRHKGFIPWDDDVDLMMDRDNYIRFIEVAKRSIPDHMHLQCQETDKNWHYPYTKIRLNNTACATEFSHRFEDLHQGIFIDIFVQDKTSKIPLLSKIHQTQIRLTHAIVRYKWHKRYQLEKSSGTIAPIRFMSLFYSLETAKKHNLSVIEKYDKKNTGRLIDSTGMHASYGAYPQEWLGVPKYLEFEEHLFPVPFNYDGYLTYLYGDYNIIPSPEDRKSHTITDVDFGNY